jgi:hypothetical protein
VLPAVPFFKCARTEAFEPREMIVGTLREPKRASHRADLSELLASEVKLLHLFQNLVSCASLS